MKTPMYPQITAVETYTLGTLRRLGYSAAAIARILGRHRSTIGREARRNATRYDGSYRPQLADWYAHSRRSPTEDTLSRRTLHFKVDSKQSRTAVVMFRATADHSARTCVRLS
jgi:IS30 family transposase